jgi:hypothetical protein
VGVRNSRSLKQEANTRPKNKENSSKSRKLLKNPILLDIFSGDLEAFSRPRKSTANQKK